MEEYKVGEVFQFGKKKLKCVEDTGDNSCDGCIFFDVSDACKDLPQFIGECHYLNRSDRNSVIFIEVKEEENET